MANLVSSPRAYREGAVLSAAPERLVVMLYDGARRFLNHAAVAMAEGQIEISHRKLRRAEEIILHLRDTLDMDQGDIASRLETIYLFCGRHLMLARFDRDPSKIELVSGLLAQLRDSWATIEP
jgi:flagellar secretion chaperone FliS